MFYYCELFEFSNFFGWNGIVLITLNSFLARLVVSLFSLASLLMAQYLHGTLRAFQLEFIFFIALLYYIFLVAVICYNYFFLFIIIELITLTLVVSGCIYSIPFSPKSLKSLVQFFVLSLVISAFFLLGLAVLLFGLQNWGSITYIPTNIENSYSQLLFYWPDAPTTYKVFRVYQFVFLLLLIPIYFKLTLAPVALWVINLYKNLPWFMLFIFILAYKFVYFVVFINMFVNVFSIIVFQQLWQNLLHIIIYCSLFVGCLALRSQNLKTILAYTTVSQSAFIIIGVLCNTELR